MRVLDRSAVESSGVDCDVRCQRGDRRFGIGNNILKSP